MSKTTIAVKKKVKKRFDDFQWETRSKSQSEALEKLLNIVEERKAEAGS